MTLNFFPGELVLSASVPRFLPREFLTKVIHSKNKIKIAITTTLLRSSALEKTKNSEKRLQTLVKWDCTRI